MDQEVEEYLYPTNDFLFKRIFGYEGNEDITKDLISCIIDRKIEKIEFKNPYLLREIKTDKEEVLDIKAVLDDGVQCDIEVQVVNYHDIDKRILDYWAKMYRQSIGKSKYYKDMKRTIVIFISVFDIDNLRGITEYKTRWKIMEENLKIELTNVFELDIIELSKAKLQLENGTFKSTKEQQNWIEFLINPYLEKEPKMEEMSEEVKKAYEIWQNMNLSEEERDKAERRYKNLLSFEYAKEYEYNQGKKEKQLEIAKRMLEKGMDIDTIIEITELTKEEIEKLV